MIVEEMCVRTDTVKATREAQIPRRNRANDRVEHDE